MRPALDDIKILGITNWAAGAFAEQLLADMGAEVVRVERPGTGDDARQVSPQFNGVSTVYLYPNRNKKSITLNLKDSAGVAMLKQLVADYDVIIENNRPGTMEKFGLDYDTLRAINPRVILTSISGYGQTGPYRDRPAYDMNVQALSGLMSFTGAPEGPPLRTGAALCDYLAGLNAAYATLVAIVDRMRTGEGQRIDVSLFESTVAILGVGLLDYLLLGRVRPRDANRWGSMMPSNTYKCSDGWVQISANTQVQWERLARALGFPDGTSDPRFATDTARWENREVLDQVVADWAAGMNAADLVRKLSEAGVPCGPVNTVEDLVTDAQFKARNCVAEVEHPTAGTLKLVAPMPRLSRTPGQVRTAPPLLGEHNAEVFARHLGIGDEELARLKEAGVI